MTRQTKRVRATKRRTGEVFVGTIHDDGLQSLWGLTTDDGRVVCISVLDRIEVLS